MTAPADPYSVLIVEDEAVIALDLRRTLESFGYHVTGIVGQSGQVLRAVRAQRPHAVLMDVRLPGTSDGISLAEEIFVCEDTPVVLLTALSDAEIVRRAACCGAYGFLTKPVSYAALTSTLGMAIEKHRDLRARRGDAQWLQRTLDSFDSAVVALDDQGHVRLMNREAMELTGWMLIEARSAAPSWAKQLHALPASDGPAPPIPMPLETRARTSTEVLVEKTRCRLGGTVCVLHRCDLASPVDVDDRWS
jgi:FixJ family two-component response regulator